MAGSPPVKKPGSVTPPPFRGVAAYAAKPAKAPPAVALVKAAPPVASAHEDAKPLTPIKGEKIWFGIGFKLTALIATLLLTSVAGLVVLTTQMFIDDATGTIYKMNADTAASLSTQMQELFGNVTEKMRVIGTVINQGGAAGEAKQGVIREFFDKDKDFLGVMLYKRSDTGEIAIVEQAMQAEFDGGSVGEALDESELNMEQVFQSDVQILTVKLGDNVTAIAIAVPFIRLGDKFTHSLVGLVRQNRFSNVFSLNEQVTSFLVDRKGRLLAHSDPSRAASGETVTDLDVVKKLLEGKANNGQTRYPEPRTQEWKLGAFRTVGFGGLGVVAEQGEAKAFELAGAVQRRAILLGLTILFIAFLTGYLYSGTITRAVRQLVDAAGRISAGDFKIDLKLKSRDEIARLAGAFNEMAKGLEERDRVKETFNKFHNKEIAEKLLSGEVKLGGERREAIIFFSDVRGFTAMSESMEPEQVVEMLNEYMTRMVSIVIQHGGVVDKYVGDAIMALWGVPLGKEGDAIRAVRACIEMRSELARLNELRISRGQGVLKIGMGINLGPVIAGNIGSNEKMEYTVIGDSVNLASRIESMTKEYGTDLLISEAIHDRVKDHFIIEQTKSAKVKGKSDAINIFKVKGYIENGTPVIVETPYSSYASEKSDKAVHDEPAKEAA